MIARDFYHFISIFDVVFISIKTFDKQLIKGGVREEMLGGTIRYDEKTATQHQV